MKKAFLLLLLILVFSSAACQTDTSSPSPSQFPAPPITDAAGTGATMLLETTGVLPPSEPGVTIKVRASDGTFRVGVVPGIGPFCWMQTDNANGAVQVGDSKEFVCGYDVEIAKRVATDLKQSLVLVKAERTSISQLLKNGEIDAAIASISPPVDREPTVQFGDKYCAPEFVIMVRADGPYANPKSLIGFEYAKISALENSVYYGMCELVPRSDKQAAMPTLKDLQNALVDQKIDAYVTDRLDGETVQRALPELKMIRFAVEDGFSREFFSNEFSVVLGFGNPLVSDVNRSLAAISLSEREDLMRQAFAQFASITE